MNDRFKNDGLEWTLLNGRLKNEELKPMLLTDWLKIREGTDIADFIESFSDDRCPAMHMSYCSEMRDMRNAMREREKTI